MAYLLEGLSRKSGAKFGFREALCLTAENILDSVDAFGDGRSGRDDAFNESAGEIEALFGREIERHV